MFGWWTNFPWTNFPSGRFYRGRFYRIPQQQLPAETWYAANWQPTGLMCLHFIMPVTRHRAVAVGPTIAPCEHFIDWSDRLSNQSPVTHRGRYYWLERLLRFKRPLLLVDVLVSVCSRCATGAMNHSIVTWPGDTRRDCSYNDTMRTNAQL